MSILTAARVTTRKLRRELQAGVVVQRAHFREMHILLRQSHQLPLITTLSINYHHCTGDVPFPAHIPMCLSLIALTMRPFTHTGRINESL